MAVKRPFSGLTPLAIANAIAKGSAIIATVVPAITSDENCLKEYPSFKKVTLRGSQYFRFIPKPFSLALIDIMQNRILQDRLHQTL